jgi:hypothetical protein
MQCLRVGPIRPKLETQQLRKNDAIIIIIITTIIITTTTTTITTRTTICAALATESNLYYGSMGCGKCSEFNMWRLGDWGAHSTPTVILTGMEWTRA